MLHATRLGAPFALAGVALVCLVLDEIDAPHDNAQALVVLGGGGVVGLAAWGVFLRTATTDERVARARRLAWDVIRYFLAFEMVRYGMAKIVGMQFYPQYWRLDLRVVELPPASLAWVFFGGSRGYSVAAGVIEVGSGVLVCFRRTTLLGACVMATALVNVVLVNFFYDVDVKVIASVFLALNVALVLRDAPRLWELFIGSAPDATTSSRMKVVRAGVVALVLGIPAADIVHEALGHGVFDGDAVEGAWNVARREGLDDLVPERRGAWDCMYFEKGGFGFLRIGNERVRFALEVDEGTKTMRLSAFSGHAAAVVAGAFELRGRELHFEGVRDGAPFALDLTREIPR